MTPSGPMSSLAAAVDGLLADTVLGALGLRPSPKRKAPEHAEAGNAEDSAAEEPASEMKEPPAKKANTWERMVNTSFDSADTPTAAAALPAPDALQLGAAPAPAVDLEAALGELLGEDAGVLPSTQPLVSTQPLPSTQPLSSPQPATGPEPAAPPSAPATFPVQQPALLAAAGEEQPSGVTDEAGTADPLPSTQPSTQPAAGSCGSAAPGSRSPAAPSGAACPTAKVLATIAAPAPGPNAAGPAPIATVAAPADCSAHHLGPTTICPPAHAYHLVPIATLPTTSWPPLPASAALAAPHALLLAAGAGNAACPAAGAVGAAAADRNSLEPPTTFDHVNMLKPGVPAESSGHSGSCNAGGWTASSSEECEPLSDLEKPMASGTELVQYGDYRVEGHRVGSGGLGTVYPAMHGPSGLEVALKLGGCFSPEQREHDFVWATFKTEWDTYAALNDRGLPWVPEAYEFGLVQTGNGIAPWITMELLGPSLHSLCRRHVCSAKKGCSTVPCGGLPYLAAYARGMLASLEGLHAQGLIHNDVKPANFTVARGFNPASLTSGGSHEPRIFLIDYGFTLRWAPEKAGEHLDFVGTPDFAASSVLLSQRPGARDDLEALGYALLDLALGDIPWDVTKQDSEDKACSQGWTARQLQHFLEKRNAAWHRAVAVGSIPAWLVSWVHMAQNLAPSAQPDYQAFRDLIAAGEAEAAAAAAAAAKAAGGPSAAPWAQAEE